jgi:hypothetical protein
MKSIKVVFAVVMGAALLLPSLGQSEEYRRAPRREQRHEFREVKVLVGVEPQESSAVCTPECPAGQICKFKGDGSTVCGKPDIVIKCPNSDPLCGIEGQIPQMHITLGSKPQESTAVCNPACPQGQICKWGKDNKTFCGEPDIVINCPDSDPLCGIDD